MSSTGTRASEPPGGVPLTVPKNPDDPLLVQLSPDSRSKGIRSRLRSSVATALPAALLSIVASVPLVSALAALRRAGWAPTLDNALISWRAWDVFSSHSPAVGQLTQACVTAGKPVFDPGPLAYWSIALPTHIAPGIGPVVGVLLVAALSIFLAVLASYRLAGPRAGLVTAAAMLLLSWSLAGEIAVDPVWNPYAGLIPFAATLVLAWVVGCGRLRWWPVLVLVASLASQTHLMYTPGSILLIVIAPALGVLARRRSGSAVGRGWALAGAATIVACWCVPVAQEISGHPGNLTTLGRSVLTSNSSTLGLAAGLRNLGRAVAEFPPVWLQPPKAPNFWDTAKGSNLGAAVVLALLLGVAAVGWWKRRPRVVAAAVVALVADVSALWVIAGITSSAGVTVTYIQYVLWPVGLMTWLALIYGLVDLIPWKAARPTLARLNNRATIAGFAVVLGVFSLTEGIWQYGRQPALAAATGWSTQKEAAHDAEIITGLVGQSRWAGARVAIQRPVAKAGDNTAFDTGLLDATTYRLRVEGWTPAIADGPRWGLGVDSAYWGKQADPTVHVTSGLPVPAGAKMLGSFTTTASSQATWAVYVAPPVKETGPGGVCG